MSRAGAMRRREWVPLAALGSGPNPGALAAGVWLSKRSLRPPSLLRWHVEIAMDVSDEPASADFDDTIATRFHLDVYSEEWGVYFCHRGRSSWIRVTDIAFVHGRDDYALLGIAPPLKDIGTLLRRLEEGHGVKFRRDRALVRSNVPAAEPSVRSWLVTL